MDYFRLRHKNQAGRLANLRIAAPTLIWTICILGLSLLAGLFIARFSGVVLEKKTAILIPPLFGAIIVAFVFGRITLLYLLAFSWFVPIVTQGFGFIPIIFGVTGWELLLWLTTFLVFVTGDIPLSRYSGRKRYNGNSSIRWAWVGLGMVSMFSWLAIGLVVREGYGMFRFAAINIICLFILSDNLVKNEKQLKRLVFWFLMGFVSLLVFQIGVGGYGFWEGRLELHMITFPGGVIRVMPNKSALLASSGAPIAFSLALWRQLSRLLKLAASILYGALLIIVFLSVSRAQIISVSVATFLIFWVMFRSNKRAIFVFLATLGITIFLIWYWLFPFIFNLTSPEGGMDVVYRFLSLGDLFTGKLTGDPNLNIRMSFIQKSLELMQPFGIGYGYIVKFSGFWEHNLFLAILNGSGILGLLGLVIFFVGYTLTAIISMQHSKGFVWVMNVAALASIVTLAINGLSIEIIYPTYPESSLVALAIGLAAFKLSTSRI